MLAERVGAGETLVAFCVDYRKEAEISVRIHDGLNRRTRMETTYLVEDT